MAIAQIVQNAAKMAVCVLMLIGISSPTLNISNNALPESQTLIAYNIDMDMDRARGEQTIEYYIESYGETLRDIIEQTLRNNENHPEPKSTAKNSYKRESALNDVLPERRSSAFSQDTLSDLRKTKNPKDILQ